MVKPVEVTVVSNHIKELILERNLMNIIKVVKPLHIMVIFEYIKQNKQTKKLILERNLINIM